MWNGLWKLTVMVGIVGVGLFAAYQAQLGMNQSPFFSFNRPVPEKSDQPVPDPLIAERPDAAESPSDDSSNPFGQTEAEPVTRDARQSKKRAVEVNSDFADTSADDQPFGKSAPGSKKSPDQLANARQGQRKSVGPRDIVDPAEDPSKESPAETNPFNDELPPDVLSKRKRAAIRNANMQTAAEEKQPAESNPFDEDTTAKNAASGTTETPPVTTESQPPKEDFLASDMTAEPGRARLTTEAASDAGIPRSKRAKRNSVKRAETAMDSDNPGPARDNKRAIIQASGFNDSSNDDGPPSPGTPQLLDNSGDAIPDSGANSNVPPPPRSLPADNSSDEGSSVRSAPRRPRSAPPPAAFNLDSENVSQLRSRDAVARQAENDHVNPLDMVGDGEIGDAAIKGLQQPRLSIEKITQQQAVVEQPLIYTIVVKNLGTADAHNIVIEDRIPKGTELQGTSPQAEMSGKRLIWNHPLLRPNEEKRISIKVIPKQEGPVGSVARVYFATEVTHEMLVMTPQLDFTVKAPTEIRIGQKFELVFALKNIGKVDASNIVVRDLVPESFAHEMGADIECPVGKLAPGEAREIVLPVTATKTGSVINRAIMTADSGVKRTLDSPIDVVGEVLVLTRTGQNRLYVERPVVFTNNIRNEGNQKADRVKITEVVPAGMEFETASDGGRYDPAIRSVVWTLGPLAPGNDKSVTVKYLPRETGTVAAKVSAAGNLGSSTAIDSKIEVIGKPELQMETLSATGTVTVGEQITSRFQLSNTGTSSANNVQLRIKLPRELRLISVKGANFQQRDDYLLFETIGELAPRKKVAYELVLEPMAEADAQIGLEIAADHLAKPGRRIETIQIARDALK